MQELKGFVNGLLNDYEAIKNAITLPWSNGRVEGHINKLKTIKRQMYGRTGFNLIFDFYSDRDLSQHDRVLPSSQNFIPPFFNRLSIRGKGSDRCNFALNAFSYMLPS
jgi:hypothetical protein